MQLAASVGARPLAWLRIGFRRAMVVGLLGVSGWAAAGEAAKPVLSDARAWLLRIHQAADRGNYEGTLVFSAGGMMSSSRVAHYVVGGQIYEQLEALDGRKRRIVRHNNVVHTLWPQSRTAVVEQREALAGWSSTPQTVDPVALEQYSLQVEGTARIADREAQVILLQPRDSLRYAQRLWADHATGLMLRADVLGPSDRAPVLESTAFSEVVIGVKPQPDRMMRALDDVAAAGRSGRTTKAARGNSGGDNAWRVVRPHQSRTSLAAEGWSIEHPVPGFRLTGCVRRGMHAATAEAPVLQAVFTDGLTHVSVFVESYNAARHGEPMQGHHGATGSAMLRRGEDWITVVGDVPMSTLMMFGEALVRRKR